MDQAPDNTLNRWLTGPRVGALPAMAELPAPRLSFEFFPPKTEALETQLWSCIRRLEPLAPSFVSVTYGAGGTTQARTHATVSRIVRETSLTPAAHLTCVGATREEVNAVAQGYWDAGVRHIVALRGDAPAGATGYEPHPGGYAYAADLVERGMGGGGGGLRPGEVDEWGRRAPGGEEGEEDEEAEEQQLWDWTTQGGDVVELQRRLGKFQDAKGDGKGGGGLLARLRRRLPSLRQPGGRRGALETPQQQQHAPGDDPGQQQQHAPDDDAKGQQQHVPVVDVAASRAQAGEDARAAAAAVPLPDNRTLSFELCNGFANQRIALVSGAAAGQGSVCAQCVRAAHHLLSHRARTRPPLRSRCHLSRPALRLTSRVGAGC